MKILDAGHSYLLDSLDGGKEQELIFVKREGEKFPHNVGSHAGTNVQEVLRALIDRTEYLNRQKSCAETESAIGCLKAALTLFELRAARCHDRFLDTVTVQQLISGKTCDNCKHIGCKGQCLTNSHQSTQIKK